MALEPRVATPSLPRDGTNPRALATQLVLYRRIRRKFYRGVSKPRQVHRQR